MSNNLITISKLFLQILNFLVIFTVTEVMARKFYEANGNNQSTAIQGTWRMFAVVVFGSQGIVPLRSPDARSAQSKVVIVRFQSYAPTLRCRCVATPCPLST